MSKGTGKMVKLKASIAIETSQQPKLEVVREGTYSIRELQALLGFEPAQEEDILLSRDTLGQIPRASIQSQISGSTTI